ncbi:hypothetical protein [Candidatus Kuenenia stuttgartiensis]|nr:hypothetical protein [Candidatus Kuenenia stuttgartiensis]
MVPVMEVEVGEVLVPEVAADKMSLNMAVYLRAAQTNKVCLCLS